MRLLALLVLGFTVCGCCDPTVAAYDRLVKVKNFSLGGIGEGLELSPGERDFRVLLASGGREGAIFPKLYREGNDQAKMYALVAMHKLDTKHYFPLAAEMSAQNPIVATFFLCLEGGQPARELIEEINKEHFDWIFRVETWWR